MPLPQKKVTGNKPKVVTVVDERTPKLPEPQAIDPKYANQPVRTVFYIEIGGMEPARVMELMHRLNKNYEGARGGIHYAIPVRHGKIGTDVEFEKEFLATINKLCEIQNGQIVFREGAKDIQVVRTHI